MTNANIRGRTQPGNWLLLLIYDQDKLSRKLLCKLQGVHKRIILLQINCNVGL